MCHYLRASLCCQIIPIPQSTSFHGNNSGQMTTISSNIESSNRCNISHVVNSYLVFFITIKIQSNKWDQLLLMEKLSEFSGMFHTFTLLKQFNIIKYAQLTYIIILVLVMKLMQPGNLWRILAITVYTYRTAIQCNNNNDNIRVVCYIYGGTNNNF